MAEPRDVLLPDIGDFDNVDVAEVLVKVGDTVAAEQSLIVLESEKASMEIPSPFAGRVVEMKVSVGDQVSQGALIARIEVEAGAAKAEAPAPKAETPAAPKAETPAAPKPAPQPAKPPPPRQPARAVAPAAEEEGEKIAPITSSVIADHEGVEVVPLAANLVPAGGELRAHASPSVRRLARELGVDLRLVPGTGPKARILKDDVQAYVKSMIQKGTSAGVPIAGVAVAAPLKFDFAQFGPTEVSPLNRIRKLSAANLHRSWVSIPHVTQHDEADITELDAFRKSMKGDAEQRGVKLTFLPFVLKACAHLLKEMPHFNASLDHLGENLILKRYIHIGVAVETPNGLVVPVVRDADRKGLYEIAAELMDISSRARERKLRPGDLQGGSFSISSLGGIGGTFFTPIVNHPEVAILGVGRMDWRPVWQGKDFAPRLMLPLSLSYDHRVIDGADGARFVTRLAELLADLRRLIL
ncbi:MAG TPA: dihydrolipoyllysine-residue acetyltransferase [Myxococcota bacterium]|nr:dihydrolipoyllysine-residue acetyltransferase [Myxococcota bacterium]